MARVAVPRLILHACRACAGAQEAAVAAATTGQAGDTAAAAAAAAASQGGTTPAIQIGPVIEVGGDRCGCEQHAGTHVREGKRGGNGLRCDTLTTHSREPLGNADTSFALCLCVADAPTKAVFVGLGQCSQAF